MTPQSGTLAFEPSPRGLPPMPPAADAVPQAGQDAAAMPGVVFSITATRAGFDALEADWNALFARSGRGEQMFQQFNWLWHWANCYGAARSQLAIVTARRGGQLVLVWPLAVERTAGLRQLVWMGDPVSQYGDVLIDTEAASGLDPGRLLAASWDYIRREVPADLVRLSKVRADAAVAPLLAQIGARITASEDAPYATLAGSPSFDAFAERFSPKLRKNRRRQLRRLEERGPLEIHWLSGSAEAAAATGLAMTLKRAWLNSRGLVSRAFADARTDAFFHAVAGATERPAGVAISLLTSCGEGADVNISVTCKGRRAIHVLAYGLKFEKAGAGNHHLEESLRRAFDDGIAVYDFLAPRHAYKMEWSDGAIAVSDHAIGLSLAGKAYVAVYIGMIREALKDAVKHLPRGLARLVAGAHRTSSGFL